MFVNKKKIEITCGIQKIYKKIIKVKWFNEDWGKIACFKSNVTELCHTKSGRLMKKNGNHILRRPIRI